MFIAPGMWPSLYLTGAPSVRPLTSTITKLSSLMCLLSHATLTILSEFLYPFAETSVSSEVLGPESEVEHAIKAKTATSRPAEISIFVKPLIVLKINSP